MAQENQRCDGSQLQDGSADELEGQSRGLSLKRGCRPSHSPKHHAGGRTLPASSSPHPQLRPMPLHLTRGKKPRAPGAVPMQLAPLSPEPTAMP